MAPTAVRPAALRGRVFPARSAIDGGLLTRRQLDSAVWRRVLRGVYADATLPVDHGLYVAAARWLMPPSAALSGASAAWVYGADDLAGPGDPVEVLVPTADRFGPVAGLRIRTERQIPDGHLIMVNGFRLTQPARTAWDLATGAGDPVEAVVVLDRLLRAGVLREQHLPALRDGLRRRGATLVRSAAALADGRSESPQETRLRVRLILAGLPPPTPQYVVRSGTRFVARVDLAYPEVHLAIEYDGLWHAEAGQFGRDRRRLNALHAAGWRVLHVTAADLYDLTSVLQAIRGELAAGR